MHLRVKVGYSEIELEGTLDEMISAIDLIPKIINITKEVKLATPSDQVIVQSKNLVQTEQVQAQPIAQEVDLPSPTIQLSKEDSIADIIMKLVNSSWGKKPRRLEESKKALEILGFPLTRSTVAVTLLRLTKSGKVRRFKDSTGEYCYSPTISAIAEQTPQLSDVIETNKSN
jgi:predicted transcriptional regulator